MSQISLRDFRTELEETKKNKTVQKSLSKLAGEVYPLNPRNPKFHKLPELEIPTEQIQDYHKIVSHINIHLRPASRLEIASYVALSPITLAGVLTVHGYCPPIPPLLWSVVADVGLIGFPVLGLLRNYTKLKKNIRKAPGTLTELRPPFQDLRDQSNSLLEQITDADSLQVSRVRAPSALKTLNKSQQRLKQNAERSSKYLELTQPYNDRGYACFLEQED